MFECLIFCFFVCYYGAFFLAQLTLYLFMLCLDAAVQISQFTHGKNKTEKLCLYSSTSSTQIEWIRL